MDVVALPALRLHDGAPGGESPHDVAVRADRVLAAAREKLSDGDVALFCHGHFSRVLAMRWVRLDVANGGLILMNPAAVTVLTDTLIAIAGVTMVAIVVMCTAFHRRHHVARVPRVHGFFTLCLPPWLCCGGWLECA